MASKKELIAFAGRAARSFAIACALLVPVATETRAAPAAGEIRAIREKAAPSFVAVQYTWAFEYSGAMDFVVPGIVVRDDGLTVIPLSAVSPALPDAQLADFKIIIRGSEQPAADDEELDAVFQGRDERTGFAFVKPKETGRKWVALSFEDAEPKIGDPVISVGLLPKDAGYRSYVASEIVACKHRGESPAWMVTGGGLAATGGAVFSVDGKAIGYVNLHQGQQPFLHTSTQNPRQQIEVLNAVETPPCMFTPAADSLFALKSPPTPEQPIQIPWLGTPQLTGLESDVAEAFGLKNQPAIEIGDVVAGSPADRGGLKVGQKIVKLNGQPLERGDLPEELPDIFARTLRRMPPGTEITLSVLTSKDQPLEDVKVKLEPRPTRQNEVRRFWADDLAFSTRDIVFEDTYLRKQPADLKGVVVALMKREGAAAAAELEMGDIITTLNGQAVTNLEGFEKSYKALRKDKPTEPIVLVVLKPDATTKTIKIEPPR